MATALLDINDVNLRLWHGEQRVQSPGYALLDEGSYRFGNQARAAARLRPRDVATRFWWQLGTDPLQPALGPARHTADLVHAHLLALHREAGEPEAVLLAVPGSMEREQLALLLGIVEQCPFRAAGLVNRSLALAHAVPDDAPLYHLEFQLHQALLTELESGDGWRRAGHSLPLPGCGLLQLQERLVEVIAAGFIRQTRFDPRRKAETEQQLYDALPDALGRLQEASETELVLNGYRVRIAREELRDAGQRLFRSLREHLDGDHRLLVEPVARLLPGLREALPGLQPVGGSALLEAMPILHEHAVTDGPALTLTRSLPLPDSAAPVGDTSSAPGRGKPDSGAADNTPDQPSHLLRGARAQPLDSESTPLGGGWYLRRESRGWALHCDDGAATALVNGQPATAGRVIHCGDTLVVDGAGTAFVIHVSSGRPGG